VFSEATRVALRDAPECEELGEQAIKGRVSTVRAYRVQVAQDSPGDPAEGDPALSSGSITGGTP
jgi:class 3 adenylate cyclase